MYHNQYFHILMWPFFSHYRVLCEQQPHRHQGADVTCSSYHAPRQPGVRVVVEQCRTTNFVAQVNAQDVSARIHRTPRQPGVRVVE
jgi:hypothetical protein